MFPDAYVKEFQKVLDRVKPFPFDDVQRTLDEELGAEKAAHLIDIEPKQLASASIAQVHTAKLRDGTPVVIKVQRPGIIARCMADMKLMRILARHRGAVQEERRAREPGRRRRRLHEDAHRGARLPQGGREPRPVQRDHARARAQAHPRAGAAPRVHDPQGARDGALQRPPRRQVRGDQGARASTARPSSSTGSAPGSSASCSTASSTATSTPAT